MSRIDVPHMVFSLTGLVRCQPTECSNKPPTFSLEPGVTLPSCYLLRSLHLTAPETCSTPAGSPVWSHVVGALLPREEHG